MAQKKGKGKRKSIRKQRWASIVAAIIAGGMLLSAVIMGGGSIFSGPPGGNTNPGPDLKAYRDALEREVENRETYIKQYGPTAAILKSLVEKYHELIYAQELVAVVEPSDGDAERLLGYREKLILVFRSLIELEPEEAAHRIGFLDVYRAVEEDEALVLAEILSVRELLHRKPDPRYNLFIISLLHSMEQEELVQEEAAWLREYMEPKLAAGELENPDRYYYAWLMGEYVGDTETALEQLAVILAGEPESGELYQAAKNYQARLQAPDETENSTGNGTDR